MGPGLGVSGIGRLYQGRTKIFRLRSLLLTAAALPSWTQARSSAGMKRTPHPKKRFTGRVQSRSEMKVYAEWCGRALALSHARSGLAAALSRYMGKSDTFDEAIATFAVAYADQNEKDHAALVRAIRSGKVKAAAEESG